MWKLSFLKVVQTCLNELIMFLAWTSFSFKQLYNTVFMLFFQNCPCFCLQVWSAFPSILQCPSQMRKASLRGVWHCTHTMPPIRLADLLFERIRWFVIGFILPNLNFIRSLRVTEAFNGLLSLFGAGLSLSEWDLGQFGSKLIEFVLGAERVGWCV